MDDQKYQEQAVDHIWPVLEAAARDLLQLKGCLAEQADVILADMRPRCAGVPTFTTTDPRRSCRPTTATREGDAVA
jgi:hypothetical protein